MCSIGFQVRVGRVRVEPRIVRYGVVVLNGARRRSCTSEAGGCRQAAAGRLHRGSIPTTCLTAAIAFRIHYSNNTSDSHDGAIRNDGREERSQHGSGAVKHAYSFFYT